LSGFILLSSIWACSSLYVARDKFYSPLPCRLIVRSDVYGEGDFGAKRSGQRLHNGIDFAAKVGTPVLAAKSGIVEYAGHKIGNGNYVVLSHGRGYKTYYCHLLSLNVKTGEGVRQGEVIGYVGKTGNANYKGMDAHLHFEMRQNGSAINPRDLMGKIYIWPLNDFRVTQEFGPADWTPWYSFHTGIDLAAAGGYGSSVRAAGPGTLIFDGDGKGYGHLIIIDHGGGWRSYYGHLMCS